MELTKEIIEAVLSEFYTRCAQHRLVGLSLQDHVNGAPVPQGWIFQDDTCYFIPPHTSFTLQ